MKFYIHPLNPHYSSTFMDDFRDGWQFGLWQHPYPALEPSQYQFQARHMEAAVDTQQKAEAATSNSPDEPIEDDWVHLPEGVDPHSDTCARTVLAKAAMEGLPVMWPWLQRELDANAA